MKQSLYLEKLGFMVGNWELTMSHAWFLNNMDSIAQGSAMIAVIDNSFMLLKQTVTGTPSSTCIIGYSQPQDRYQLFYHDERGVDRIFDMTITDGAWTLAREDPDFHQRFTATLQADTIKGTWEASEDNGHTWRKDFDLTYTRV